MADKTERLTLRLTPDAASAVREAAAEDGCSVSESVRARVAGRRARPRRSATEAERQELARVLAAIGRIGGHSNQLAYQANRGMHVDSESVDALRRELESWRDVLTSALPDRP